MFLEIGKNTEEKLHQRENCFKLEEIYVKKLQRFKGRLVKSNTSEVCKIEAVLSNSDKR